MKKNRGMVERGNDWILTRPAWESGSGSGSGRLAVVLMSLSASLSRGVGFSGQMAIGLSWLMWIGGGKEADRGRGICLFALYPTRHHHRSVGGLAGLE